MKVRTLLGVGIPLAALATSLAACGSSTKASAPDYTKLSCAQIASTLGNSRSYVTNATTAEMTSDANTPRAATDTANIKSTNANISQLVVVQKSKKCGTTVPASDITSSDKRTTNDKVAVDVLTQLKFGPKTYTVDKPINKAAAAKSTTGPGRFTVSGYIDSAAKAVAFLASGTPAANAALKAGEAKTGASKAQLLDPTNWVIVQWGGTPVQWNGNSAFFGGITDTDSSRIDGPGTVGAIFIPPNQVAMGRVTSVFVLRGPCGNVQFQLPTPPGLPVPPTCTLTFRPGYVVTSLCTYVKPPQSFVCEQNGRFINEATPNVCPPNEADQIVAEGSQPASGASRRPMPNYTATQSPGGSAPRPVRSPGYSGTPGAGTGCNNGSCSSGPVTATTGPPVDTGQGGNNSAPPSAPPTEACGPLTVPYVLCP